MKELIEELRSLSDVVAQEIGPYSSGLIDRAITALESAPVWVSVSERLPDQIGSYLVYGELTDPDCHEIAWVFLNSNKDWCGMDGYFTEGVTHWMPLPAPPIVEKG